MWRNAEAILSNCRKDGGKLEYKSRNSDLPAWSLGVQKYCDIAL
jgi:hypothetical protein